MSSLRPWKRRAYASLRQGVTRGCAAILLLTPSSGARAQSVIPEFYYHGPGQIPILLYTDSIGIAPRVAISGLALQSALASSGLTYVRTLPEGIQVFALPARLPRTDLFAFVRQLGETHPALVAQAGVLARRATGSKAAFAVPDQLIVQFNPGVPPARIDSINNAWGAVVAVSTPFRAGHYLLQLTPSSAGDALSIAQAYHHSSLVQSVYPNMLGGATPSSWTPNDPYFVNQWHLKNTGQNGGTVGADVNATAAWDITKGDPSVVIAIIELAGFDAKHADLVANLWTNPGELPGNGIDDDNNGLVDDVNGWNFSTSSCPVGGPIAPTGIAMCGNNDLGEGLTGHATAVAGLAAAVGDNNVGVTGMCPKCRLMLVRAGSSWYGKVNAFMYARKMGAKVINASWNMDSYGAVDDEITAALTDPAGGRPVIVALNNVDENECDGASASIAAVPGVIAVGSSTNKDTRVPQTGTGSCIDLLAPGASAPSQWGITTTDVTGADGYNSAEHAAACLVPELGDLAYTNCFGGASAAAPIVSGIVGLMLSVNPGLAPLDIEKMLRATAKQIEPAVAMYDGTGFSSTHGYGRVNAGAALAQVPAPAASAVPGGGGGAGSGVGGSGGSGLGATWFEFGFRAGVTWVGDGVDHTITNLPGGGPLGRPAAYGAWVTGPFMLELQLGFAHDAPSPGTSQQEIVVAVQPALLVPFGGGHLYAGLSPALQALTVGGATTTDAAIGAAVGYRYLATPHCALRMEARYRHWNTQALTEVGWALGAAVVIP